MIRRNHSNEKELQLEICVTEDVSPWKSSGFERYQIVHNALPDVNLKDVDVSCSLCGKKLSAPIAIAPMTGGHETAAKVNRNLAIAAQNIGVALSVGSQRVAIENPSVADSFKIRDAAPDVLLFANIGAVQLNYGFGAAEARACKEMIGADALMLHLNPLQEALKSDGHVNFAGLTEKITRLIEEVDFPIFVREVCNGISEEVTRRLIKAKVAGIDVGGAGGTSWMIVERLMATDENKAKVAETFSNHGISTVDSIINVRKVSPDIPLIATGGLRSGRDIAKSLILGADIGSMAAPFLKAALMGPQQVVQVLMRYIEELKITMFCVGKLTIKDLKSDPSILLPA